MSHVSGSIEFCEKCEDQDKYIRQSENSLAEGLDIDLIFLHNDIHGTVLAHAVECGFDQIVRYALDKGASITTEIQSNSGQIFRFRNVFEISMSKLHTSDSTSDMNIFEMLKEKSLELFSSNGLTPFHIDCATDPRAWRFLLDPDGPGPELNATIDVDSPFWAGMTPLLVAAKFNHIHMVGQLLYYGALPNARDSKRNTPLHYLISQNEMVKLYFLRDDFFSDLFLMDGSDTFSKSSGESHFHIACRLCPKTLDIVKKYLEQGISANLQTKERLEEHTCKDYNDYFSIGKTGLHIAASRHAYLCPDLTQLLLVYDADVNLKDDGNRTALDCFVNVDYFTGFDDRVKCVCMLLESGATSSEISHSSAFYAGLGTYHRKRVILRSIKKKYMIAKTFSSQNMKEFYRYLLDNRFKEINYEKLCLEELNALSERGLRQILEDTIIKSDFKEKFEALVDSGNFQSQLYPIYRNMLKIQIKRKLFLYKQKRQKINEAVPSLQLIFQNLCNIPDLVAENILWNISAKDIDKLIL